MVNKYLLRLRHNENRRLKRLNFNQRQEKLRPAPRLDLIRRKVQRQHRPTKVID